MKSKPADKNYCVGKCRGCEEVFSGVPLVGVSMFCPPLLGVPERLRAHVNGCEKVRALGLWEKTEESKPKKQKVQAVLNFGAQTFKVFVLCVAFCHHILSFQVDELDRQVGRMVYATNSAFRIVENKEFLALMQLVRPGIKIPSRRFQGSVGFS